MSHIRVRSDLTAMASNLANFILVCVGFGILLAGRSTAWNSSNCPAVFCRCFWLYGIRWADCSGRYLYNVQTGVDSNVQALHLFNNSISSLANYELRDAGLVRLKLLNLSSNVINEIGLMAFVDLPELRVLDLSRNHLYFVLSDTFVSNRKLEVLKLADNNLNEHVPKLRSSSLSTLDLNNCGIGHLPSNTFDDLPRLRVLDIADNALIHLDIDVLKKSPNLGVLMIDGNPWNCNNGIFELQKYLRARRIHFKRVCLALPEVKSSAKKLEKMIAPFQSPISESEDHRARPRPVVKNRKSLSNASSDRCQTFVTSRKISPSEILVENLDKLSPYYFLAFGVILGSALGAIFTYLWMSGSATNLLQDPIESGSSEVDQRISLLQNLWQSPEDSRPASQCPGTPPPPYRDVILHAFRYPRPEDRGIPS